MNLPHISLLRLHSQQLAAPRFSSAKELVAWMGALQAQDAAMVKWAVGLRLAAGTEQRVNEALDNGETIGIWKRTLKKDLLAVEMKYFAQPASSAKKLIEDCVEIYAKFLGKKINHSL